MEIMTMAQAEKYVKNHILNFKKAIADVEIEVSEICNGYIATVTHRGQVIRIISPSLSACNVKEIAFHTNFIKYSHSNEAGHEGSFNYNNTRPIPIQSAFDPRSKELYTNPKINL